MYRWVTVCAHRTLPFLTFRTSPQPSGGLARGALARHFSQKLPKNCRCGNVLIKNLTIGEVGLKSSNNLNGLILSRALVGSTFLNLDRRMTQEQQPGSHSPSLTFDPVRHMSERKNSHQQQHGSNDSSADEKRNRDVSSKRPPKVETKPTAYQRLKQMWKSYWYVVLPVHLITSGMWFGSFYVASRSGVDIVELLNYMSSNVAEYVGSKLERSPRAQHLVVAYALYKIFSPVRYAVTLGGTTVAIRYLSRVGVIRPVPSGERMREMASERWERFEDHFDERRDAMRTKLDKWRERRRSKSK